MVSISRCATSRLRGYGLQRVQRNGRDGFGAVKYAHTAQGRIGEQRCAISSGVTSTVVLSIQNGCAAPSGTDRP